MQFLKKSFLFYLSFLLFFAQIAGINEGILLAQTQTSSSFSNISPKARNISPRAFPDGGSSSPFDTNSPTNLESPLTAAPIQSIGDSTRFSIPSSSSYNALSYQIHILGEVRGSGTFRIPASTRLYEALNQAGGISNQGSERSIQLRRQGKSQTIDLFQFRTQGKVEHNPYLLDNDVIFVPLREKVVRIEGAIKKPGVYEIVNDDSLASLIRLVGGFTPGADLLLPIKIIRIEDGKQQVLSIMNTKKSEQNFRIQKGDVVFVPHILTADKQFDYSVSSYPGDNELFYPTVENRVFVLGGVNMPGPLPFNPAYRVRQYLTLAGGTTKLAKVRKIHIINARGKITRARQSIEINPGDTVVVPERYLAPESILSLVLGLTTSLLGITTTVLTLTR